MQMSRKTVGLVALVLVVIMLIPAVIFAKPVWFTKSRSMVFTVAEQNFTSIVSKKIFGDGTSGKVLNHAHSFTGVSSDYRELTLCFDSHKILPFEVSVTDVIVSGIPDEYEDRVVAKLSSPMSGGSVDKDQAQMSFLLYTAGMSDAEVNEMVATMEICVKWNFVPGITGADKILIGE